MWTMWRDRLQIRLRNLSIRIRSKRGDAVTACFLSTKTQNCCIVGGIYCIVCDNYLIICPLLCIYCSSKSAPVSVNRSESYKETLTHARSRNRRKTSDPSLSKTRWVFRCSRNRLYSNLKGVTLCLLWIRPIIEVCYHLGVVNNLVYCCKIKPFVCVTTTAILWGIHGALSFLLLFT